MEQIELWMELNYGTYLKLFFFLKVYHNLTFSVLKSDFFTYFGPHIAHSSRREKFGNVVLSLFFGAQTILESRKIICFFFFMPGNSCPEW